jgi:pimeloyl-ACP methyl ester carboxylesterase
MSAGQNITLAHGRRIHFRRYGDPNGRPVVMLHGTPGSSMLFTATDAPARDLGLCVIAPDRWGYGFSDAPSNPTLSDYADDIGEMMTALGYSAFAVSGFSGGGPYAAAVAARLGARISAAALVSPVGLVAESMAAGEVSRFHRFCFRTLARRPSSVERMFRGYRWAVARSPRVACGLVTALAPRADKQVMADCAVSQRILGAFSDGLAHSTRGPAVDLALFGEPWSFDPATIIAPTKIWIGTLDTNVPIAAAHRLAARISHAELEVLTGEGHLWVALHYPDILGWMSTAWIEPASQKAAAAERVPENENASPMDWRCL